jgi:hypothetical protein
MLINLIYVKFFSPKLTVVVVKKRSNARFFLKGDRNEFVNAPVGTIISNTVVKKAE